MPANNTLHRQPIRPLPYAESSTASEVPHVLDRCIICNTVVACGRGIWPGEGGMGVACGRCHSIAQQKVSSHCTAEGAKPLHSRRCKSIAQQKMPVHCTAEDVSIKLAGNVISFLREELHHTLCLPSANLDQFWFSVSLEKAPFLRR